MNRREVISVLEGEDPQAKKRVLCQLSERPHAEHLNRIVDLLGDASWEVRYYSVDALIVIGAGAIPSLVAASRDSGWTKRMNAVRAMGEIGDLSAVPSVISRLADSNPTVRYYAAKALGFLGDERALRPLWAALEDEEGYVRWRVVWAIGQIDRGGESSASRLLSALRDSYSRVRLEAIKALSYRKADPPVWAALKRACRDRNHKVSAAAKAALL
jgi:HEAT repeat protein